MFHDHQKFNTLTKVNATLQAILAGDEVMNFILPLGFAYGTVGRIYSLAFCVMFIVCIHNVLIFIISESFKMEVELEEKSLARKKNKDNKQPNTPLLFRQKTIELQPLMLRSENTLAGHAICQDEQIVEGEENINFIKKKVFNKIIPQSRDTHIIQMLLKKDIIKNDIHYLKQSIQDLSKENLSSIH